MSRTLRLLTLFTTATLVLVLIGTAGAEKIRVHNRISFKGKVVVGRPLEIDVDHDGLKLEAITFSEDEALLIVWNRTPSKVTVNAGLALYDKSGRLIAAESDDRPLRRSVFNIKSGKQANLTIKLKKFVSDVDEATHFQAVVAVVETEDW